MSVLSCCIVWILLSQITDAAVFVSKPEAASVLRRWRRANSGFLEEMKAGNLERECIEEKCDYEEAREVFEDDEVTKRFWLRYESRDPCEENPCQNAGSCIHFGTSYQCVCREGYVGQLCEMMVEQSLGCLYHNGGCQHFCDDSGVKKCFCADGYKLGTDGRTCIAQVQFPCGLVPPKESSLNQSVVSQTRLVGANHCPKGECPWQVLIQLNGESHCGGVLIDPNWVVTAAHCIHGNEPQNLTVVAGEHNLDVAEGTEQSVAVSVAISHPDYDVATGDSDIALLRLNESVALNQNVIPICLPTRALADNELKLVRYHTVSGWGKRTIGGNKQPTTPYTVTTIPSPVLRVLSVPILPNPVCAEKSKFNFTANMLCAGYLDGYQQSCRGDDGSPLVTLLGPTRFLTGVAAWGRGCPTPGLYGVYTNMAEFVEWVERVKNEKSGMIDHDAMMQQKASGGNLPPALVG